MGKPPCGNRTQDLLVPKSYPTTKMPLGYKAMGAKLLPIMGKSLLLSIMGSSETLSHARSNAYSSSFVQTT
ncbi:hypothetical protein Hanom_Chr00s002138g01692671 [Helianthus anomalus]